MESGEMWTSNAPLLSNSQGTKHVRTQKLSRSMMARTFQTKLRRLHWKRNSQENGQHQKDGGEQYAWQKCRQLGIRVVVPAVDQNPDKQVVVAMALGRPTFLAPALNPWASQNEFFLPVLHATKFCSELVQLRRGVCDVPAVPSHLHHGEQGPVAWTACLVQPSNGDLTGLFLGPF
eukprot:scaffold113_cov339-Pavlova_lutheri.AAC.40